MRSTLQVGWRDPAPVNAAGMGRMSWPGRQYGPAADGRADPSGVPDDASLVARSRVDAEAFGALYDRYCDRIYRYVFRKLGNHEAAEDVTADVFVKVLRAIDSYSPAIAAFSTWLYRIAANAVIDYARARHATVSLDAAPDTEDLGAPVDELAISRVEADRVWRAIDGLTEAQRTAVTLRFGSDLPIAEIAGKMGRTEGAIKLLLNRALTAVRSQLAATRGTEDEP